MPAAAQLLLSALSGQVPDAAAPSADAPRLPAPTYCWSRRPAPAR